MDDLVEVEDLIGLDLGLSPQLMIDQVCLEVTELKRCLLTNKYSPQPSSL